MSVRLAYETAAVKGHSHPYELGADLLAHALKGLLVHDRQAFPLTMFKQSNGQRRVFSNVEAKQLAALLNKALSEASPRQIATFHWIFPDADKGVVITSGGLFVDFPRLVIVIANCRAVPLLSYEGITSEVDTRHAPLVPYRPRAIRLTLQDQSVQAPLDLITSYYRFDDEGIAVAIDVERLRLAFERLAPQPEKKQSPAN